ncbi:hypothetical protein M422DRAFT_259212 [Sphaerobolus stellatus SS14]|uniref:Unplaced genomic scaffold SPHSTscaffold_88, whole genome shotgun sequence n=1 Tax=Sphaerobolus stellatus (strain SS14) TaxID=990650 RepID=A0A0C9UT61_SPHS4|nr:hypothetical protein M422DRAFT_259212 [Sphaerobolus stellatus SS14]
MKQSCVQDRSKRLGFICQCHDTKGMLFITFAPNDDSNPPPTSHMTSPTIHIPTLHCTQVVEKEVLKRSEKSAQPKARNTKEPVPTQLPMDVKVKDDGRYHTPPPSVEPVRTKGKGLSKAQHIEAEPITRRPRATASTSTGAQRPSTRNARLSSCNTSAVPQLQHNTTAPDAIPNTRNTTAPAATLRQPLRPSHLTEGCPRVSPAPVVEGNLAQQKDIPSGAEKQDCAAAKKQRKDSNNNTLPSFPNIVVQPATMQPHKRLPSPPLPAAPPQPPTHTGALQGFIVPGANRGAAILQAPGIGLPSLAPLSVPCPQDPQALEAPQHLPSAINVVRQHSEPLMHEEQHVPSPQPEPSTSVRLPIEHIVSEPMGKKVELQPGWSVPMDSLTWCNKAGLELANALARLPASTPDYKKKVHDFTSMVITRFIEHYK